MDLEIAVILCTLDRPLAFADALRDVHAQLPDRAELVVVDQSADPAPVRAAVDALSDPRIAVHRAAPGLPAARNLGVARSRAPVVWFVDDDVRLQPGALAAHLAAYADPRVGGVVGRIEERVVRPNARGTTNRVDRAGRVRTRLDGDLAQPIETLKGCNMSFRRQALAQAGDFDPGFGGTAFLEDADMSTRVRRAGWRLRFVPGAALTHLSSPRGGVRAPEAQAERWRFHNTARFVRKHRGWAGAAPMLGVFGAIAVHRSARWRDPRAAPRLLAALARGWRSRVQAP